MYEKILRKISNNLISKEKKEYFILTRKRHNREVYFQDTEKAIEFIKIKFDSSLKKLKIIKKIIYFLIKARVLQIFLKRVKLSAELGDVIFVADQIKGFNLNNKVVYSFPKDRSKKSFIKFKIFQKKVAEKGFAPQIIELNHKFPFSKEELLPEYKGENDYELFKKLHSFYKYQGIKIVSSKKYINSLINKIKEKGIKDSFIKKTLLDLLLNHNQNLLVTAIHGNFTKEQVLLKKGSYVFIDWESEKDLITRDLTKFFSDEENLLKNKNFLKLLKTYPKEVRKNIKLYLILNEISLISQSGEISRLPINRIKSILKQKGN